MYRNYDTLVETLANEVLPCKIHIKRNHFGSDVNPVNESTFLNTNPLFFSLIYNKIKDIQYAVLKTSHP